MPAVNGAAAATTVKSEDTDKDDMREVDKEIGNGLGPADVIGGRTLPNWMKEDEAVFMESRLRELLDDFSSSVVSPYCSPARSYLAHSTSCHLFRVDASVVRPSPSNVFASSSTTRPPSTPPQENTFAPSSALYSSPPHGLLPSKPRTRTASCQATALLARRAHHRPPPTGAPPATRTRPSSVPSHSSTTTRTILLEPTSLPPGRRRRGCS